MPDRPYVNKEEASDKRKITLFLPLIKHRGGSSFPGQNSASLYPETLNCFPNELPNAQKYSRCSCLGCLHGDTISWSPK
jgi:hypothetical protein